MSEWIDRDAKLENRRIYNMSRLKNASDNLLDAIFTQIERDLEYFSRTFGNLKNASVKTDRAHSVVLRIDGERSLRATVRVDVHRFKLEVDRSSESVASDKFDITFPNETAEWPLIWNGSKLMSIPDVAENVLRPLLFPSLITVEHDPRGPVAPNEP